MAIGLALAIALFIAAIMNMLFTGKRRRTLPWPGTWPLFLLFFLLIWLGGIWLAPFGMAVYGVYWGPFLAVGILIAHNDRHAAATGRYR